MKLSNIKIWLLSLIAMIIAAPNVLAAQGSLLGNLIPQLTTTLQEFLSYGVVIPHLYPIGDVYTGTLVPIWALFAVFTLVFSIVYAASAKISIFADNSGARKAFSVAFSLLVMFGSPLTEMFVVIIGVQFTSLMSILLAVLFFIGLWFVIFLLPKKLIGSGSKFSAGAGTDFAAAAKTRANNTKEKVEASKIKNDADIELKDSKRERDAAKKIHHYLDKEKKGKDKLIKRLKDIQEQLDNTRRIGNNPTAKAEAKNKMLAELATASNLEHGQRALNARIDAILGNMESLERRSFRYEENALQNEQAFLQQVQQDLKNARPLSEEERDGEQVERYNDKQLEKLSLKILEREKEVYKYTRLIEQLDHEIGNLGNQFEQAINEASQLIHNDDFPQASGLLARAIEALQREEQLLANAIAYDDKLVKLINNKVKLDLIVDRRGSRVRNFARRTVSRARRGGR